MKKLSIILLTIGIILLAGCTEHKVRPENKTKTDIECTLDSDCERGGCSSQLCLPKDKQTSVLTTCEFRPEYSCISLTNCSCAENKCKWEDNKEYVDCLEEKKE